MSENSSSSENDDDGDEREERGESDDPINDQQPNELQDHDVDGQQEQESVLQRLIRATGTANDEVRREYVAVQNPNEPDIEQERGTRDGLLQRLFHVAKGKKKPLRNFDRRLPATHSYLGSAQGEFPSNSIFEDVGNELRIPVLVMNEVCLLPGQKMPLQFYTQASVNFFENELQHRQQKTIALLCSKEEVEEQNIEDLDRVNCYSVGTLFQIRSFSTSGEDRLTIQIIGRQRCKLLSQIRRHHIYSADLSVLICDQISVQVLDDMQLPSQIFWLPESSMNKLPNGKERLKIACAMSPHSQFVMSQSSTEGAVRRLTVWLLYWFTRHHIDLVIAQGLTQFSYWVAANIPISLDTKLRLLEETSTDKRLANEWQIVSQMNSVLCGDCDDPKCKVSDIINLCVEGNSTHFVNPGGYVHDLFTVRSVERVEMQGQSSAEFSWFPGYKWTVVNCQCGKHLGWRFTSDRLIPRQFFGISRRSFRLGCVKELL